jgi:protein phosphatase 2C
MHVIFEEEVMRVGNITAPGPGGASSSNPPPELTNKALQREIEEAWRRVLTTCFLRMDELATGNLYRCDCEVEKCACMPTDVMFSGSTAVVVILTQDDIIVANCGDSRAVLCRGGRSMPLSIDHKV